MINRPRTTYTGFTLVEMAVVLVIVGLMLGGILLPLSTQMENERRKENQATLESIREALIGYAVVNGRLPCPDTDNDGQPGPGVCNTGANQRNRNGLPYGLLGVSPTDAWGNPWVYIVNGEYTTVFTRATPGNITGGGNLEIWDAANCTGTRQMGERLPAIVYSNAKNNAGGTLEPENRDTDRCFVSVDYTQVAPGFDDQLIWVPTGVLFSRMVAAGTL